METFSPGEELTLKTRKPYTITKQRERWTEEEHNRFLEALKLYGRAWQRIEEHIGTKTAVQIRSHAQKFFSKLEKEAVGKGTSQGHSLDIDIPPPRPKRKPSYPYPRKSYAGASTSLCVGVKDSKSLTEASSLFPGKELPDMKNDSLSQKPAEVGNSARDKEVPDEEMCSEVNTHHKETSCVSIPSANKSSISSVVLTDSCTFREFASLGREKGNKVGMDRIANTTDTNRSTSTDLNMESCCHQSSHEKLVRDGKTVEPKKPENHGPLAIGETQADQSYPMHVPVHIVDGSSAKCIQSHSPNIYSSSSSSSSILYHIGGVHGNPYMFINPAASAATDHGNSSSSSVYPSMPTFPPPFAPVLPNPDVYRSVVNISSTFSSFLMSNLLQNPAAHMAAHLAASFCSHINGETSAGSSVGSLGGFPMRHTCVPQNLAAIAAATVAAASAWWAAHGLLPVGPPVHPGFNVPPAPTTVSPMHIDQVLNNGGNIKSSKDPALEVQLNPEFSEATKPQHSDSKCPALSLSDSAESADARSDDTKIKSAGSEQKHVLATVLLDSNKLKAKEKVDRSSCGSNTPSSSDLETDVLEKHDKDQEELKEPNIQQAGEPNNRRSRSATNINDSWKEVSEEGRLAFHALFSREILPQSFSPPHDPKNPEHNHNKFIEGNRNLDQKDSLHLDLKCSCATYPDNPDLEKSDGKNEQKDLLSVELGQGKFRPRRIGFKPYKRCSVEAKEIIATHGGSKGEEKGPKRIRLDGQASG